jgi:hypothetical protein
MGWTRERYLHATIEEFNLAAGGYWRNHERNVLWLAREVNWTIIQWAPFFKQEDKPKRRDEIMKLGIDEVKKEKEKPHKITEKDLKVFDKLRNKGN